MLNKALFLEIHVKVMKAVAFMEGVQRQLHADPRNPMLADEEVKVVFDYKKKHKAYMSCNTSKLLAFK